MLNKKNNTTVHLFYLCQGQNHSTNIPCFDQSVLQLFCFKSWIYTRKANGFCWSLISWLRVYFCYCFYFVVFMLSNFRFVICSLCYLFYKYEIWTTVKVGKWDYHTNYLFPQMRYQCILSKKDLIQGKLFSLLTYF